MSPLWKRGASARWACPNGKQNYRCHGCGRRSRENPPPNAYPEARCEEMMHAYQESSSLRGLTRTFGLSGATPSSWIKKRSSASFHTTLLAPDPEDATPRRWNWTNGWLVCAQKSERLLGVDYLVSQDATGGCLCSSRDQRKKTCQRWWENIPSAHRHGHCFTDFWAADAAAHP